MSTVIVRPASVSQNGGGIKDQANATTSAAILAALNDNSDTTYVVKSGTTGSGFVNWCFTTANPTIASGEFIARAGHSVRWKVASSNSYSVGGALYLTDIDSTLYNSYSSPTTTSFANAELYVRAVTWSPTVINNNLRLWFYFERGSQSSYQQTVADIWASLYTIAIGTSTPSNVTSTVSIPVIPVAVAATIDWEADTQEATNLRKVTTEVRIESGGTGAGTGVLVATKTFDQYFTATGTSNISVTMPAPIANGTYKIYARSIRYRETGSVQSDQYGAWSSAYTLTQNVALPNTPTLTASADNTTGAVTLTANATAGNGYSGTAAYYFERSIDSGASWSLVRGGNGLAGTFGANSVVVDREAPRGVTIQYRARISAVATGLTYYSNYSTTQSATLTVTNWNLKCPEDSSLNIYNVTITGTPGENLTEDMGVFRPLNTRYPKIVAGQLGGWDGDLNIQLTTAAEWAALKAILESQKVLLLESPFGWAKYVRIVGGANTSMSGTTTTPRRVVTLNYVQTTAP